MPTSVPRRKTYPALVNDAINALKAAAKQYGVQYHVVLAEPNPDVAAAAANPDKAYKVTTRGSKYLFDLHVGQELQWRAASVIRSSKQQESVQQQRDLNFSALSTPLLRKVVTEVLIAAIHDKAGEFPFGSKTSEDVACEYAWYPAAIAWRSAAKWTRAELLQLLDSLRNHPDLQVVSTKVLAKLDSLCNATDLEQVKTAFQQLERGGCGPLQPVSSGAATTVDLILDTGAFQRVAHNQVSSAYICASSEYRLEHKVIGCFVPCCRQRAPAQGGRRQALPRAHGIQGAVPGTGARAAASAKTDATAGAREGCEQRQ